MRASPLDVVVSVIACGALLTLAAFTDRLVANPDPRTLNLKPAPLEPRDRIYGVAAPTPDVLWLAGGGGKIVRSDDAGRSWRVQTTPVTDTLQDIAAWDATRAIAVGDNGAVLVTQDGGTTWRKQEALPADFVQKLLRVRVTGPGAAWIVGTMGTILRTGDGGATWEVLGERIDVAFNDAAFPDPDTAVLVGEFGRIVRSTDGGRTWRELPPASERSLMSVAFRDARNGAAVGLDGQVLVTGDGGASWSAVDSGTHEHLFAVAVQDGSWIAVGDMGVVVTGAAGADSWQSRRLGEHEFAWHAGLASYREGLFLVGATRGTLNSQGWTPLALQ